MFQKYGSDPVRRLLVDHVESTAVAHQEALEVLKAHDQRREAHEPVDIVQRDKEI
jgi:hypothetical protein